MIINLHQKTEIQASDHLFYQHFVLCFFCELWIGFSYPGLLPICSILSFLQPFWHHHKIFTFHGILLLQEVPLIPFDLCKIPCPSNGHSFLLPLLELDCYHLAFSLLLQVSRVSQAWLLLELHHCLLLLLVHHMAHHHRRVLGAFHCFISFSQGTP